ncbi:interferon-induced guanylate-binding protein, putative [Ricinus communis]|uniref:Interferon-induced guanylate-binding protein, putative n=1 Tax=Ricinus communis TaxID=3988 RepID=B9RVS9_RICCO|nr:interferon-induced guanylate-binding protein, putative [Ricinus communis]
MEDNTKESNSGKPIRFVYFDDANGKFKVDPDAIDLLQQIKGPVGVVSVCGPARQGKSFILNQLLGRSTGFQVGSTHQLCTKGLWMWSAPLKKIALDGTEYNLLLFDSGGTNTCDQTEIYSTQIFSVAVLLSSLFVYNQVGVIDEAALDHLSLVTEMTKHVHRRASQGKNLVSELGHFSPVFMWLLRDFYLDLTEDNIEMKPHDYLELALSPVLGSGRDIAAKNKIRESIRAVFPSRECFTLVRPLNNETDLQHLDRVSLDKFRPEFLSGLHAFANFVYERTRPKQAGDNVMTGPLLAGITKSLVDALNNGAAPTISFSWQVCTRDSVIETDLECSNAIQGMEKRLQEACLATDAKIENLAVVLESLLSKYEESVHGPTKWQKLSSFLQKSLQGPFLHHAQKLIDEASLEKSSLIMKCRSNEDKIELLHKQLEASEKSKAEYQKCYADAIDDFKKLSNRYKSRKIDLESKSSLLEERCSSSLEMLDSAKQEALEWKRKYEEILTAKRAANDQANTNTAVCKSGICEAEATVAATAEQSRMALKEANEWKEKYDIAINEAKAARDKAAEQAKLIEEDVAAAAEQSQLALKEAIEWKEKYEIAVNEVKAAREKAAELAKLKEEDTAETKIESYVLELSALKHQMKELAEKYDFVKAAAQSMEREAQTLIDDRVELEQKCLSELKRFEEAHEGWKVAKEEVMVTNEFIEAEQSEVLASQDEKHDEKHESHQLTIDRLAQTSSHIHTQVLERAKMGLAGDIERSTALEDCAMSKIAILEAIVKERDEEIELLKKKCEQFVNTIPTLESNLESEHAAHAEVNKMEKAPFLPLESLQEGLNLAQQELTPNHSHGYAQGSGLKTYSGRKHPRLEVPDLSVYSLKMETPEEITREMKKPKSSSAMAKCTTAEIDSVFRASEEDSEYEKAASVDYTKLTVWKLRRELNEHGFGEELQKLRYPKKKDVIALYEKFVLKK